MRIENSYILGGTGSSREWKLLRSCETGYLQKQKPLELHRAGRWVVWKIGFRPAEYALIELDLATSEFKNDYVVKIHRHIQPGKQWHEALRILRAHADASAYNDQDAQDRRADSINAYEMWGPSGRP